MISFTINLNISYGSTYVHVEKSTHTVLFNLLERVVISIPIVNRCTLADYVILNIQKSATCKSGCIIDMLYTLETGYIITGFGISQVNTILAVGDAADLTSLQAETSESRCKVFGTAS